MARHYELTLIVDSQAGDEAVTQTVGKYETFLTDSGAEPVIADRRGVRKLAYEVKKHLQADYTYIQFSSGEVSMIHEMDRLLRLDQSVLRHMFIKMDLPPVVPIEAPADSTEGGEEPDEDAAEKEKEDEA
jgi:small subunit ribosomal protein S6